MYIFIKRNISNILNINISYLQFQNSTGNNNSNNAISIIKMLQNIFFFLFENWEADISRMLARIKSSNVELLYIQTGTGGAFNSSFSWLKETCIQIFLFHINCI